MGTGEHEPDGRPISRSASLRLAFRRARALAKGGPVDCVHLIAAVLEQPDAPLARALAEAQAQAQDIYKHALASSEEEAASQQDAGRALQTLLEPLLQSLREKHGVALRVTPESSAFVVEQAGSGAAPIGLEQALERWVRAPLEALAAKGTLGKLKHKAWNSSTTRAACTGCPTATPPRRASAADRRTAARPRSRRRGAADGRRSARSPAWCPHGRPSRRASPARPSS